MDVTLSETHARETEKEKKMDMTFYSYFMYSEGP